MAADRERDPGSSSAEIGKYLDILAKDPNSRVFAPLAEAYRKAHYGGPPPEDIPPMLDPVWHDGYVEACRQACEFWHNARASWTARAFRLGVPRRAGLCGVV